VTRSRMWLTISSARRKTGVLYFSAKLKASIVRSNISCGELGAKAMIE